MKYSTRRRSSSGVKEPPMLRLKNTPTDRKYRNASGDRTPICGASLEALESKLNAIEQTKQDHV